MQILKIIIGSFAFMGTVTLAAAAEAPVANLYDASGKILVDQGQGFVASAGQSLKAGDRVFVGDKSSAAVVYATCTVKLDKPTVFMVSETAPCAKGASVTQIGSVIISPTVDTDPAGGVGGGGGSGLGTASTLALVGASVVVGGTLLLLTTSQTVSKP